MGRVGRVRGKHVRKVWGLGEMWWECGEMWWNCGGVFRELCQVWGKLVLSMGRVGAIHRNVEERCEKSVGMGKGRKEGGERSVGVCKEVGGMSVGSWKYLVEGCGVNSREVQNKCKEKMETCKWSAKKVWEM